MATDTEQYDDNITQEELNDIDNNYVQGSEDVKNPTAAENFFGPEDTLYMIEKFFSGYRKVNKKWEYKGKPIARDEFISKIINSMRSVMNTGNMISKVDEEALAFLLLEKNKEIIYACFEEPTLDEDDLEYVVNVCDHAMQLFVGHLAGGHGSKVARQMSAAIYHEQENKIEKKKSFLDEMLQLKD